LNALLAEFMQHRDFAMSMFLNAESLFKAKAEYYQSTCKKLEKMLIERDGGDHDNDCKFYKEHYGNQCNCGHSTVKEYFGS